VATVLGDSVRTGPMLAAALGLSSTPRGVTSAAPADLRARAESLYRDMRDALRRGDWTAFGRAFEAMGTALRASQR
jgi:uncharacterized membrane protein (UPF0182 family)